MQRSQWWTKDQVAQAAPACRRPGAGGPCAPVERWGTGTHTSGNEKEGDDTNEEFRGGAQQRSEGVCACPKPHPSADDAVGHRWPSSLHLLHLLWTAVSSPPQVLVGVRIAAVKCAWLHLYWTDAVLDSKCARLCQAGGWEEARPHEKRRRRGGGGAKGSWPLGLGTTTTITTIAHTPGIALDLVGGAGAGASRRVAVAAACKSSRASSPHPLLPQASLA